MPFVPFPHQINDPVKLRRILKIVDELLTSGKGIDDPSLGYTLFRRQIIRSRSGSGTVAQQLKQIKTKPASDQSPLTIARDIRRLFLLFGFISESNGKFSITDRGQRIRKASGSQLSLDEKRAWLEGLLELKLPEAAPRFHPGKIMLEMMADGPIETRSLAFAFTAADDTDPEAQRLKGILKRIAVNSAAFPAELTSAGITQPSARDSVKIIPAIMEQAGLITRKAGIASLTSFGRKVLDNPTGAGTATVPSSKAREPFYVIITPEDDLSRKWKPADLEKDVVEYETDSDRAKLLKERTDLHQATLDKLRKTLEKEWRLAIGNFDLLAEKGDEAVLYEVKTIKAGNVKDQRLRIIDGLGKLLFYETFDVPFCLKNKNAKVDKAMVFDRKPDSSEHVDFLKGMGISVFWFDQSRQIQKS